MHKNARSSTLHGLKEMDKEIMKKTDSSAVMEKIVSLCKRRGFIFQSSEIYGGLNGCWDYGPLGVELLRNYKDAWWQSMTYRDDVEGLDAAILMHPRVWEASGHVENFTDPMVDCKECKARFREDQIEESLCGNRAYQGRKASKCLAEGKFTEARQFNLMFKTYVGPLEDSSAVVYLRPETAQGIYVNFHNVMSASRQKVPFGIAQIGKAFRNEINTRNFLFRTREFEQMEMQYFVKPGADMQWFDYWMEERKNWYLNLGFSAEKLNFHKHEKLAHYAAAAFDIEFLFPFGWGEIEGIHNRTDYDLRRHQEFCGKSLDTFDEQTKEKFIPYVIETSAGASRGVMATLVNAYQEEEAPTGEGGTEIRTVMKFHPRLAPVKAAVLPLVKKDGMPEIAMRVTDALKRNYKIFYDESGTIGKRYRRQDEIGTPVCITIDSETLQNQTVTVRDRDEMKQERVALDAMNVYLQTKLS